MSDVIHRFPARTGGESEQAAWAGIFAGSAGSGFGGARRADPLGRGPAFGEPVLRFKGPEQSARNGGTAAGPQRNHVAPRLEPLYAALLARVAEKAAATIGELRAWVAREHGVTVSHPVMWHTLARLGLTLNVQERLRMADRLKRVERHFDLADTP